MNSFLNSAILLSHAGLGVFGIIASVWVFIETLNASANNAIRTQRIALLAAILISAACVVGGYWYTHDYAPDKAVILKGPWPWAHGVFMETKEHLFFITLILAIYLPIACTDKPHLNQAARKMVLTTSALIVLTGLYIEGAGAIISQGAKLGFEPQVTVSK